MKRILAALLVLLLLIILCTIHVVKLAGFTHSLVVSLEQAQQETEQGNWDKASQITQAAFTQWHRWELYLHITLHHKDTDAILASFGEVLAYLEGEEQQPAEYAAANSRLIIQLSLLAEDEVPSLKNLL